MAIKQSILFVHNGIGLGGAPKALRYIIEACVKAGHSCSVACLACPDTNPYFRAAGANVILVDSLPRYTNSTSLSHKVNSRPFRDERNFAAQYAIYWRDLLKKHGAFSLVFINSMTLCDLIKPSRDTGCRVIQAVRETAQHGPSLDIMKGIISEADAVLFISEYDRDLFSLNPAKCVVIPDAVDSALYSCNTGDRLALRQKNGISEDEIALLFTGGNGYIKGGELLLESLCRVSSCKKITVLYAGYGSQGSNGGFKALVKSILSAFSRSPRFQNERIARLLSRAARKKSVTVKLLGYRQNIDEYFKISDLCAIPYAVPHQAMPIFEAGMAKMPCLATAFPCFRDEITDGDNGYLLPVSDPDAWARAIKVLAENSDKRKQMGASNYRRAIVRHDIRQNAEKMLRLINNVLTHEKQER